MTRYIRFARGYDQTTAELAHEILLRRDFDVSQMQDIYGEPLEDTRFLESYPITFAVAMAIPFEFYQKLDFDRFDYFLECDDENTDYRTPNEKVVWSEDDCTTNDPDHETLDRAWERFYGEPQPPKDEAVFVSDWGDATFIRYANGRIAVESYPGGNEIRELTK